MCVFEVKCIREREREREMSEWRYGGGGGGGGGYVSVQGPDEAGVVLVRICWRQKNNAINLYMMKAIADLFTLIGETTTAASPSTTMTTEREQERAMMAARHGGKGARVVVLTGLGEEHFCAGVDLTAAKGVFQGDIGGDADSPFVCISKCPLPVVCAVNGAAFTAGLELALSCDIIVAGPSAKFADTHCKYGIMPSGGASARLPRLIGASKAKYMTLTSTPIDGKTAVEWGLASVLSASDADTLGEAMRIAQTIARHHEETVRGYKSNLDDGGLMNLGDALRMEKERAYEAYRKMPANLFERMKTFKSSSKRAAPRPRM